MYLRMNFAALHQTLELYKKRPDATCNLIVRVVNLGMFAPAFRARNSLNYHPFSVPELTSINPSNRTGSFFTHIPPVFFTQTYIYNLRTSVVRL
jgi:hypothetical protein